MLGSKLGIVNIAHPAFIMLGSFVAYIVNSNFGIDPILIGVVISITKAGKVAILSTLTFCSPAGLALNPATDELLANCNTIWAMNGSLWTGNADRNNDTAAPQLVILSAKTGLIMAHVLGAGVGDEAWFNSGDNHYYAASSGSNLAPNVITPARPPLGTATTAPVNVSRGHARCNRRTEPKLGPAGADIEHPGGARDLGQRRRPTSRGNRAFGGHVLRHQPRVRTYTTQCRTA